MTSSVTPFFQSDFSAAAPGMAAEQYWCFFIQRPGEMSSPGESQRLERAPSAIVFPAVTAAHPSSLLKALVLDVRAVADEEVGEDGVSGGKSGVEGLGVCPCLKAEARGFRCAQGKEFARFFQGKAAETGNGSGGSDGADRGCRMVAAFLWAGFTSFPRSPSVSAPAVYPARKSSKVSEGSAIARRAEKMTVLKWPMRFASASSKSR